MPVQKRNEKGMTGYNALWDKQSAKDTADHVKSRVDNYTDLVNGMFISSRVIRSVTDVQVTTMVLLSSTSTDGPTLSTSVDSTRERLSSRLSVHFPITRMFIY